MEATILDNGNLELYLPEDEYEDVEYTMERHGELQAWTDIWEPYFTNGMFQPISPESHFVGLTDDPYIIIEDISLEDNGDYTAYGGMWHYPNYMLYSVIRKLLRGEKVQLQKHYELNGETIKSHYNI